ncbi:hypothetical protein D4Q85_00040 [bacterium]|nr:MAG: hypothetical protein D4Q85_00040 [bacterium]
MDRRQHAFSLVEAAIAVAPVGITAVGALTAAANAATRRSDVAARAQASLLADELAAEIAAQAYEDPQLGGSVIGPDTGEAGTTRALFDDADDYNAWTESGIHDKSGTAVAGLESYTRSAAVIWVQASDISKASLTESGVKMITVTVTRGVHASAIVTLLRTKAWEQMTP